MRFETLDLSSSCKFSATILSSGEIIDVSLEYIEQSPDPWYSDHETSISIDRKTASELILFLQKYVQAA